MNKKVIIVSFSVIAFFLFSGCIPTTVKYQCQDGSFVDSSELCSQLSYPELTETKTIEKIVTKYQCANGIIVESISECPSTSIETQVSTNTNPDLLITINSASDTSRYLHNPTITVANEGSSVSDLVFDIELYKNSNLVAVDTDVIYESGSNYITSVPSNDAVKGYLNVMIYNGNTEGFTSGMYTLKIIVRKGISAKPLATAEKQVTFSS
ncbi:hypothetical protein GOV04_01925 [Candidatus Woesearchaeota archaeon]|nr:hypothetical protein [Candidatus Woesearchaeota archaeon]